MVTGRIGERMLYTLRVKTFSHMQRLGLDFYEREMAGRLMTRMTSDIDALSTFLQNGVSTTVVSILTFFGIAGALVIVDLRMSPGGLRGDPDPGRRHGDLQRRSSEAYNEARDRISAVNADLQENVAGHAGDAGVPPRGRQPRTATPARPTRTAGPGCARSATSPPTSRSCSCSPTSRPRSRSSTART